MIVPSPRVRSHFGMVVVVLLAFGVFTDGEVLAGASDAGSLRPGVAPAGFKQQATAAFVIQTDVPGDYLGKLARQIYNAETRMYSLFRISDGFLRGNDPKSILDKRFSFIKGDILSSWGYKPWIEIRVFNSFESYADEWFDESNRMDSLVNKTPVRKESSEERAIRRITEGIPGAYYMRTKDYDDKYGERRIRGFLGRKAPEEMEGDMLHELGHLFLETFLMEFAGAPKTGQESQKRGTPAWIGEGVAQLFEVNWASSRESKKKKNRYNAYIYEAIKAKETYPFGEFIDITNAHNLQAVAGDPLKSTINYAQSYSVMQYMVERDWQRFLKFLENCRAENLTKMMRERDRISELYSIQDKAFKDAFTIPIVQVEAYWKKYCTETMEKLLKSKPEQYYYCGEYHLRKSDHYQRTGDKAKAGQSLAEAEAHFKKAIAGSPSVGDGYLGMGRVHYSKGEFPEAVKNLTKATELSSQDEEAWYYRGAAEVAVGKSKEAIASFEKAVAIFPLFHQAQIGLGNAYYESHQYDKALLAYQMAFEISKHPSYLLQMGHAAFFAGEYNEAMKNYAAFSNIFKNDADGHFWYGMAAMRLDQKDYAIKKLEEALKLRPNFELYAQALEKARKGEKLTFTREGQAPQKGEQDSDKGKGASEDEKKGPPGKPKAADEEE